MTKPNLFQVHIELLRIQTFLFAVPRLRDMIGANVLLGETIRVKLPRLAINSGSYSCKVAELSIEQLPPVDKNDPLYDEIRKNRPSQDNWDDPRRLYQKGILSRDGGHFRALFPDENSANNFKNAAESMLIRNLPGLRFEISIVPFEKTDDKTLSPKKAKTQAIFDLPPLQVCQESGNGPAVAEPCSVGGEKEVWVSETTRKNKEAGARFFRGLRSNKSLSRDIIGLLNHKLPPVHYQFDEPTDLQDVCGNDYLAVIHADGNSVGRRFKEWLKKQDKPSDNDDPIRNHLLKEAHGERFFHSMRVAVRRAVVDGLGQTFYGFEGKYRPYQLLMLGGDDLLLVCQAKYAFDFLVHYAEALTRIELVDGKPLSIGAGVVIASPNLPFHHLHHLAEELAGSAKRLFRSYPDKNLSVVDWIVSSNSWVNDPIALRQADARVSYEVNGIRETLALSGRPYAILSGEAETQSLNSLEALWKAAQTLTADTKDAQAARSQLRKLVSELAKGRRWADLCLQTLAPETLNALSFNCSITSCWQQIDAEKNLWLTVLADLIELYEIPNLKRQS